MTVAIAFALTSLAFTGACETAADKSTAPSITNLQIQDRVILVGVSVGMQGSLDIADPDGNLATLHLEMARPDGSAFAALDVPIAGASGQTSGNLPYAFDFTADAVGRYALTAWVVDADGQTSNHLTTVTSEVAAPSTTPSVTNLSANIADVTVGRPVSLSGTIDFQDGDGDLTTLVVTVKDFRAAVLASARVPVEDVTGVLTGTAPLALEVTTAEAGNHTLEVVAEDAAGHTSNVLTKTFVAVASTTAPTLRNLDIGGKNAYVAIATTLPVTFDFTDSDHNLTTLRVRVKAPGGDAAPVLEREVDLSGLAAVSGKASGTVAVDVSFTAPNAARYSFEATLADALGERSNTSVLTFDAVTATTTAPKLFGMTLEVPATITAQQSATIDGTVKFEDIDANLSLLVVRIEDQAGSTVKEVRTNLDVAGQASGELDLAITFTPASVGFHTLVVSAEDGDGQAANELTRGLVVEASATAPAISALDLGGARALVGVAGPIAGTIDFSDSDGDLETLELDVLDPSGASLTSADLDLSDYAGDHSGAIVFSLPVTAAVAGRHTLTATVVDAAGQRSSTLTRAFDAIQTATTPSLTSLSVTVPALVSGTAATLTGTIAFADVDGNIAKLHLRVVRPNGTFLIDDRQVSVSGHDSETAGAIDFSLDVTADVPGRHTLEVWLEDAAGQKSSHEGKNLDVVDSRPSVTRLTVVYDSLFATKADSLSGTVDISDADGDVASVAIRLLRPDQSVLATTNVTLDVAGQTRLTVPFALSFTPDVAGSHTLEAKVTDGRAQTSAAATQPVAVGDASTAGSACAALEVDCAGEGLCYDVDDQTCAYFESHELSPPDVCADMGSTGSEALCVSSVTDAESPLLDDANRCTFVQYWSYPTDMPIDCRCPEARFDHHCTRPYESPQALSYGSGPRIRSLAPTIQAWRGLVRGREWLLPVKWSTFDHPNETMIFGVNLDTGARRHFSGAWDDPQNGYAEVGEGDKFLQIMDIADGPDGQLYAVGAASDIAAPKLWRIDPTTGARTKIFDEDSATAAELCPNFSSLPGRKTVQMAAQGWTIDAQGRFYFSNVGMPGPSILRMTVAGVGGATQTSCEYVTRIMDCPTCTTQQDVGSGYSTIQFDMTAFSIVANKLYTVSDKRFLEIDLTTGKRKLLSLASDVGAIGTGPINGEGLADRWTTWDASRQVFWTVGILGGSAAVTVDPATGDRASWPCFHDTRGVLEGCGGTGMALVPGPLNFGGMVIDPAEPHDLYFAHDQFSIVKYEVRTGNAYVFSM